MSFTSLGLAEPLLRAVAEQGYDTPSPIQQQAIPAVLAGRDLMAAAQTGTGKTAGFTLPMLQRLTESKRKVSPNRIRALVLTPTRELAAQVGESVRNYGKHLPIRSHVVFGGVSINPQMMATRRGLDVLVACPGRLMDLYNQNAVKFDEVEILVLDEADRMLDMGFGEDINRVISHAPRDRQTLLFSATYPEGIAQMSRGVQRNPVEVSVESLHEESAIEQKLYEVPAGQRLDALTWLLSHYQPGSCVVFCNTKRACNDVADHLAAKGFSALALNGDLEQRERDQVLVRFANGSATILVATDVAARGLDIKELGAVINYELTYDPEVHVHRIGRTGRAGQQGLALSLYQPNEAQRVNFIEEYQQAPIPQGDLAGIGRDIKPIAPQMVTLSIDAGRKSKVRAGDILGALTGEGGIAGADVGKIQISEQYSYVAVKRQVASAALKRLQEGKIKGRSYRARKLG